MPFASVSFNLKCSVFEVLLLSVIAGFGWVNILDFITDCTNNYLHLGNVEYFDSYCEQQPSWESSNCLVCRATSHRQLEFLNKYFYST